MKYIVLIQSSVIVNAKTPETATNEVNDALEDARTRNCGNIDDEILAGAMITKIELEESDEK